MRRSWSRKGLPFSFWVLLLAMLAGGFFRWQRTIRKAVPFRDIRALELSTYLERPSTLRGSSFTLRNTVHQTLASSIDAGRLILLMTLAPKDSSASPEPVPLQVPPDMLARMQTGRQFVFKVMVGEAGVLMVQDAAKI